MNLNLAHNSTQIETEELIEVLEKKQDNNTIVLYNDDVNTFEFVTNTLIEVCKHEAIQAEQCTYLVHYVGKCSVKAGTFKQLRPICEALLDRGLSATIE